jgi:glycosyltransferase involved in cell wall biosynthesis
MIYVCIPSHNEAPTVGLLLWKIRQVFSTFEREYQLLVGDDGSTDATREILQPYTRALPLTVIRSEEQRGYARTIEGLLRLAVERTDRPKRDCAIMMHADFAHGPHFIPDLVRHIDGGADVVVGEGGAAGEPSRGLRFLRRMAPVLLRSRVGVPGVNDIVSGFVAFRLITLRNVLRDAPEPLLRTDGWAANAELIGLAARHARRIETVPTVERHDLRHRPSRLSPWDTARALWRSRGSLHFSPPVERPGSSAEREVELVS